MTLPWYRRFPDNFIAGTVGLTLEEKGAYSLILDLMYVRGGPVPDEPRYIAGVCNCSVRKWNAIRQRLIDLGKIEAIDGHLTNHRAEIELENAAKTSREHAENGAKGGNKSAEMKADAKKNNALEQAGLDHTRASLQLNSVNKKGKSISEGVQLDRFATDQEALFEACERVTGKPIPSYMQKATFPTEVVTAARQLLLTESAISEPAH